MKNKFVKKGINFLAQKKSLKGHLENNDFRFIAPFYHTVSNNFLPHIHQLYQVKTTKAFIADLELFLKYYKPISEADLVSYLEKNEQLPKKRFFLSFDDGFKECETEIAPILKRYGINATFFVNGDFIENRNLMFRNKIALLLNNGLIATEEIKNLKQSNIAKIDKLAEKFKVSFEDFLQYEKPYLTKAQLLKLKKEGFTIGNHSLNHPYFSDLSLAKQIEQVENNKKQLEVFNIKCNSFAFPFTDYGVKNDFFDYLKSKFKITFACAGIKNDEQKNHIQRIAVEDFDFIQTENLLKFELQKFRLLKLFGKENAMRF